MLQVNYVQYFYLKTLGLGETLDLTHVTSQIYRLINWYTPRLDETLNLTHITSQLYIMFYALRLVDTLDLTHFIKKLYSIF